MYECVFVCMCACTGMCNSKLFQMATSPQIAADSMGIFVMVMALVEMLQQSRKTPVTFPGCAHYDCLDVAVLSCKEQSW